MSITKLSPSQLAALVKHLDTHAMAAGGMVKSTSHPFTFQGKLGAVKRFDEGGSTDSGGSGEGGSYTHADDARQDAAQDAGDSGRAGILMSLLCLT